MIWSFRIAVDFGLVVLIWLVQLIIYPSFQYYSPAELAVWHPNYSNLITVVVGPLMLAQVGLVGWLLLNRFSGDATPETLARLVRVNWVRTVGWTLIFLLGVAAAYRGRDAVW